MPIPCDTIFLSFPTGADFTLTFDTSVAQLPLNYDNVVRWQAVLRSNAVDGEVITIIKSVTNPSLFRFQPVDNTVQVVVPWTHISSYQNSFGGGSEALAPVKIIYAELTAYTYGDNIGIKQLTGTVDAVVNVSSKKPKMKLGMSATILSIKTTAIGQTDHFNPITPAGAVDKHRLIDNVLTITSGLTANISKHKKRLSTSGITVKSKTTAYFTKPSVFGPIIGAIGANRYKLPTSPYQALHQQLPVDTVLQSSEPFIDRTIYARDGCPMDLGGMKVFYVVNASYSSSTPVEEIPCAIIDADNGLVRALVPSTVLSAPGVYLASFVIYNADDLLMMHMPRYLEIEPASSTGGHCRPITIMEVRMALRDFPHYNNLLESVEFTDNEIAWAIQRPLDIWNSTPPSIGIATTGNFPWRAAWLDGVLGELFATASFHYIRNSLPYQSAGITVDDKAKFAEYTTLARDYQARFKDFVTRKKFEINIDSAWAYLPGPYSRLG